MTRRAVFLDRDGVINRAVVRDGKPYPPRDVTELDILPGVPEALARLREAGFLLFIVTNQPDVARGTTPRATVDEIHRSLSAVLAFDGIYTCFHDDADRCRCRKPLPGLLQDAARASGVDLTQSFMVGDRWRDIEAGRNAECRTILIDYQYAEKYLAAAPDHVCHALAEAADWILAQPRRSEKKRMAVETLKVKIFADGADRAGMLETYRNPLVKGLTTNPTLMRKAGVADYEAFARDILSEIKTKPISLEVFSDEFDEMERQAMKIASWGDNVYVKIPVTNTKTESSCPLIKRLADRGVKLNVTAMMTLAQVRDVVDNLNPKAPSYVSVFAGRIADTGRDPKPLMAASVEIAALNPTCEVIWASPRELLNVFEADAIGCQIITVTNDIIKKLSLVGYDLDTYSLDTVKMFHTDAVQAGYKI